jgi:hypothetical protein
LGPLPDPSRFTLPAYDLGPPLNVAAHGAPTADLDIAEIQSRASHLLRLSARPGNLLKSGDECGGEFMLSHAAEA